MLPIVNIKKKEHGLHGFRGFSQILFVIITKINHNRGVRTEMSALPGCFKPVGRRGRLPAGEISQSRAD